MVVIAKAFVADMWICAGWLLAIPCLIPPMAICFFRHAGVCYCVVGLVCRLVVVVVAGFRVGVFAVWRSGVGVESRRLWLVGIPKRWI